MKKPKPKTLILILTGLLILVVLISSLFTKTENNEYIDSLSTLAYHKISVSDIYQEEPYSNKKVEWSNNAIYEVKNFNNEITAADVIISPNSTALRIDNNHTEYGSIVTKYYQDYLDKEVADAVFMKSGSEVEITPQVTENGLYSLGFDFYDVGTSILPIEISVKINGEYPYYESRVIRLSSDWRLSDDFPLDRYQNEIMPSSMKIKEWKHHIISDSSKSHRDLMFSVKDGDTITITGIQGEFLFGYFYIKSLPSIPTYQEYLADHSGELFEGIIEIPAETMAIRNDPSLRLRSERDPSASSYHSLYQRLNAIDGGSWRNGGQTIAWEIDIPKTGYYQLSFKYLQNTLKNMPVFREIRIDGIVPYQELSCYAFPYARNWMNRTITDSSGEPLKLYFTAGTHKLSLTSVNYPYRNAIERIRSVMNEITQLSLNIKKYTGNSDDAYKDWDIDIYIPNAKEKLMFWAADLINIHKSLLVLSDQKEPAEISNLLMAAKSLNDLSEDVNKLPSRLVKLSDGDSSVSQQLGDLVQRLMNTSLHLQGLYLHGNEELKNPRANLFVRIFEGIKRLFLSFTNNPYRAHKAKEGELTVWVNHPRQFIEIMQTLIDSSYEGPLKVTLSQMPDENKLILANATGRAPDIAIGVNHWIPHDFAIRKAALNLRQFSGYQELVSHFSPGVMIPYAFEEGIYGIPETQNFWVTYYRRDILSTIGIDTIPQTWDEVVAILPQLQRYGMNYFSPLSMFEGFKPYVATLPFITQFGGTLYTEDGMATAINSSESLEGMELMTDLFTLYNIPERVPNFYNHFRYGTLPIGISDLSTYLLLTTASPELQGLWDIALHPGVEITSENGTEILRYAAGGSQSSMILSGTKYPKESWDFLQWWMSEEVQVRFAINLQTTYGQIYFWNTANLDAFRELPLATSHKETILKQWEYAIEATRIPGSYMVEREISNAWNRIVFDGINPRLALDNAVRISNREILYKMEEFGYAKNGVKLRDYRVPTIDTIEYWLTEDNYD